jgi:hypothetical protein
LVLVGGRGVCEVELGKLGMMYVGPRIAGLAWQISIVGEEEKILEVVGASVEIV